jgi:hypothetical protein
MKEPIAWHRKNANSIKDYALRKRREAEHACYEADRLDHAVKFLELQIKTATMQGKDSFDSDKFLVKRKKP